MYKHVYWIAENTGWSGGVSWFATSLKRHSVKEGALREARLAQKILPASKHRITKIIHTEESFEI